MRVESFDHDPALRERFVELPFRLYAGDGRWIPPSREELRRLLSPANPFFVAGSPAGAGAIRCFLASREGRDVARAAAIVNPALRHRGEPAGLVGFFESEDDEGAAAAVLEAATAWLRARGLGLALGPLNFSIWHSYRLMTKGFDRVPFLGEPYNPPHYPSLFERLGWAPAARWYSWDLELPHLEAMRAFARAAASSEIVAAGYRIEPLRLDRFEEDLARLHALMTDAFSENLFYTPISLAEFAALYGPARAILIPELVPFVIAPGGQAVGGAYLYPDARSHAAPPDRVVLHTMAIEKAHRRRGIVETFLAPVLDTVLARGFRRGIGALAKEGPTIYAKTGPASREYTLYERRIA